MSILDKLTSPFESVFDSVGDFISDVGDFLQDPSLSSFGNVLFSATFASLNIATGGFAGIALDAAQDYVQGLIPEQDFRDRKRTARSAVQAREVIYGRVRTGGHLVYIEDAGKDNTLLWMCIVVAGHEVEEIETVYFNDIAVATSNGPGVNGPMNRNTFTEFDDNFNIWSVHGNRSSAFIPTSNWDYGDDSYDVSSATPPNWTTDHRLAFQSYVWINLGFDKEAFGDSGIPQITVDVKGKNDIFDPRDNSFGYTTNQALCVLDLLLWDRFFNADSSEINMDSFKEAANIADEQVTTGAALFSPFESRYTVNGSFKMQAQPIDILQSVASAGASFLSYTQGVWSIIPGSYSGPVMTMDESDLIGGMSFQSGPGKQNRHNTAKGTYVDPNQNFESVGFPELSVPQYIQDDGEPLEKSFEFAFTNSGTMARRLAKINIERNRFGASLEATFKFTAIRLEPGDRIALNNERLGWNGKVFRVESTEISLSSGVKLSLREDAPEVYDWVEGDALALDAPPLLSLPKGLDISGPLTINFTDSIFERVNGDKAIKLSLSWNDQPSAFAYDIQYKLQSETEWTTAATYWQDNQIDIPNLIAGDYDFRIRSIIGINRKSPWTTAQHSLSGFTASTLIDLSLQAFSDTPPSPQANFSTIRATVTPPSDPLYSHALVEYQVDGDSSWITAGPTDSTDKRDIIVISDGSTFNVRAFSVSTSGIVNPTVITKSIVILDKDNQSDVDSIAPLLAVTNLGIDGGTTFTGRDADITWNDPNEERDLVRSYRVTIKDTSFNVMRTAIVTDTSFTYTFEMNSVDFEAFNNSTGANRSFVVEVTVIGNLDSGSITHESNPTSVTVTNPPPGQPSSLSVLAGFEIVKINLRKPSDLDYLETRIYLDLNSGFTVNDSTFVTSVFDGSVTVGGLDSDTDYFIKLRAFDVFGPGSISSEIPFTTATFPAGGPWAGITVADKTFIDQNMADDSVDSTKIEKLVAGKIATGFLAATARISVGDPSTEPYTASLGAKNLGSNGVSLIGVERNSNNDVMFGFFESGLLQLGSTGEIGPDGSFIFGDVSGVGNSLTFDAGTGDLTLKGSMQIVSSSSGYNNLTDKPTSLVNINSSEGNKLSGVESGADVTGNNTASDVQTGTNKAVRQSGADKTSSNTSSDTSNVNGQSASSVKNNANSGATFTSSDAGSLASKNSVDRFDITSVDGGTITTGTIDASQVNVTNINASNITAGTITGRTLQTSFSGERFVVDDSDNQAKFFDSSGNLSVSLGSSNQGGTSTNLVILGNNSRGIVVQSDRNPLNVSAQNDNEVGAVIAARSGSPQNASILNLIAFGSSSNTSEGTVVSISESGSLSLSIGGPATNDTGVVATGFTTNDRVGSIVFARNNSGGSILYGQTVSGNQISASDSQGITSGPNFSSFSSWKCLGEAVDNHSTLFIRIT